MLCDEGVESVTYLQYKLGLMIYYLPANHPNMQVTKRKRDGRMRDGDQEETYHNSADKNHFNSSRMI